MKARHCTIASMQVAAFQVLVVSGLEVSERIQVCDTIGILFREPYLVSSKLSFAIAGRKQICIVSSEDQLRIFGIRSWIIEEADEFRRKCWMKTRLELINE